ncbi:MAG: hypothetical protein KJN89_13385 [Gammaproteobacteria bacterium]|nr:hypothetical protein [Gammaproteobacteria bacterium]NNJ51362.1 hypothetical protein [Gammaproteobacteria bacterium]
MNVFVLNTGRCGSTTFIKACQHIRNYTSSHESLMDKTGQQRLDYPDDHIEADNRLSWFLGQLDKKYADDAIYVHLKREREAVAESFSKRIDFGILKAYEQGILLHNEHRLSAFDIALDYIDTVNANIELFLKDKTRKIEVSIETVTTDFPRFWKMIDAKGDLDQAIKEWSISYNAS